MDCPVLVQTTTGSSPSVTVRVGYAWPNGTSRNECGFAIAGGTVNADGTSTAPTAYPFICKFTLAGYRLQPGCKMYPLQESYQTASARTFKLRLTQLISDIETYDN